MATETATPGRTDARFDLIRRRGGDRYAAFRAAGYGEYFCPNDPGHNSPYLLQRAIREEPGGPRLFFINLWVYDFTDYEPHLGVRYQAEAQFHGRGERSPTFNVTMGDADLTPPEIEAFFRAIYDRMACAPYDAE